MSLLMIDYVHCVIHTLLVMIFITFWNAAFSLIFERNINQVDTIFVRTFSSLHNSYSQKIILCLQEFVFLLKILKITLRSTIPNGHRNI